MLALRTWISEGASRLLSTGFLSEDRTMRPLPLVASILAVALAAAPVATEAKVSTIWWLSTSSSAVIMPMSSMALRT